MTWRSGPSPAARAPAYADHDPEGASLWKQTQAFYEQRQLCRRLGRESAKPRPQIDELDRSACATRSVEGLDPDLYNVTMLEERRKEASKGFLTDKGFDPKEAGALDVWLHLSLHEIRVRPCGRPVRPGAHADPAWKIKPEKFDALAHLEKAIADSSIKSSLAELTPRPAEYASGCARLLGDYARSAAERRLAHGPGR